jgi:hypothetical protein
MKDAEIHFYLDVGETLAETSAKKTNKNSSDSRFPLAMLTPERIIENQSHKITQIIKQMINELEIQKWNLVRLKQNLF